MFYNLNISIFVLFILSASQNESEAYSVFREFADSSQKVSPSEAVLIVEKNGVFLISHDGKNLKKITSELHISDSFWPDSNNIYLFGFASNHNMKIYNYNFEKDATIFLTELKSQATGYEYWGYRIYDCYEKVGNNLIIYCDAITGGGFHEYRKAFVVDLSTGKNKLFRLENDTQAKIPLLHVYEKSESEYYEPDMRLLSNFNWNAKNELMYLTGKNWVNLYKPKIGETVSGYYIYTPFVPKSILFQVNNQQGDYQHGPIYVSDSSGVKKIKLVDDFFDTSVFYSASKDKFYIYSLSGKDQFMIIENNQIIFSRDQVFSMQLPPHITVKMNLYRVWSE